jgi:hypothetical protein
MIKVLEKNGFDIYFEALPEDMPIDDRLWDPEHIAETIEKIDSGEWVYFCAKVSAYKAGIELGVDYLGACIYESEEAFYTEYKDGYFADMVDQAIDEAKSTLEDLAA